LNIIELITWSLVLWLITWLTITLSNSTNIHLAFASFIVVASIVTIAPIFLALKRRLKPPPK